MAFARPEKFLDMLMYAYEDGVSLGESVWGMTVFEHALSVIHKCDLTVMNMQSKLSEDDKVMRQSMPVLLTEFFKELIDNVLNEKK